MDVKHIAMQCLVTYAVICVVGRVTMLKTLAGFQATS